MCGQNAHPVGQNAHQWVSCPDENIELLFIMNRILYKFKLDLYYIIILLNQFN